MWSSATLRKRQYGFATSCEGSDETGTQAECSLYAYSETTRALYDLLRTQSSTRGQSTSTYYHYTRELVEDGVVSVEYIPTTEMAADCLTKPLKRAQLEANLAAMGLVEE
jgi:hypothetical protein